MECGVVVWMQAAETADNSMIQRKSLAGAEYSCLDDSVNLTVCATQNASKVQ
jgi:hypothetical protein